MTNEQMNHPRSYTLREAAGILGVSVTALRRRAAADQLRAERVDRPQGSRWRVYLDAHTPDHAPSSLCAGRPASTPAGCFCVQPPVLCADGPRIDAGGRRHLRCLSTGLATGYARTNFPPAGTSPRSGR